MGKAKLSPVRTVPHLELCAAVLAVELAELITSEIDMALDDTTYFTDSKVVLGYIHNETQRFYVYVSNRVLRICKSSHPNQWKYVCTAENPANIATRSVTAAHLQDTNWLCGPKFLLNNPRTLYEENAYELVNPSSYPDVCPEVSTLITTVMSKSLGTHRFSKFSTWKCSTRAVACLLHISRQFHKGSTTQTPSCKGWHYCSDAPTVEEILCAEKIIIKVVQQETYAQEYKSLETGNQLSRKSPLKGLDLS
ncbi:Nucleolar protein 58 [Labeo rohita]|uniref:Nucleolar protein 58 n=1 Tax=Labeo rohita TaxID=84645 RepID=A0ABQ8L4M9_LABRO|nr:Nucleolar protein 58 [Labeo rohita]